MANSVPVKIKGGVQSEEYQISMMSPINHAARALLSHHATVTGKRGSERRRKMSLCSSPELWPECLLNILTFTLVASKPKSGYTNVGKEDFIANCKKWFKQVVMVNGHRSLS